MIYVELNTAKTKYHPLKYIELKNIKRTWDVPIDGKHYFEMANSFKNMVEEDELLKISAEAKEHFKKLKQQLKASEKKEEKERQKKHEEYKKQVREARNKILALKKPIK